MTTSNTFKVLSVSILLALAGCSKKPAADASTANTEQDTSTAAQKPADAAVSGEVNAEAVATQFRKVASAMYKDSLTSAKDLQTAIKKLVAEPNAANLQAAKAAYKIARVPYQQSEIMRFDTPNVTEGLDKDGGLANVDDWEGQVNAWPLDEALIDYVDTSYVGEYADTKNIINTTAGEITVNGASVDVTKITPDVIASLNEIGGSEANVASGVHAIEFLLWGQDTNGTKAGAGNRSVTDFMVNDNCTSGDKKAEKVICERRVQYLEAAAQLLVDDLTAMNDEWSDAAATTEGTLAYDFLNNGKAIKRMIKSMGDMSAGELASERMRISVLNGSTEDEHDCFSDLTHVAIHNNAQGIANAFRGSYTGLDGKVTAGASLKDLLAKADDKLANEIDTAYTTVLNGMQKISDQAEATGADKLAFDQQIVDADAKANILAVTKELDDSAILLASAAQKLDVTVGEFDQGTCDTNEKSSCVE